MFCNDHQRMEIRTKYLWNCTTGNYETIIKYVSPYVMTYGIIRNNTSGYFLTTPLVYIIFVSHTVASN